MTFEIFLACLIFAVCVWFLGAPLLSPQVKAEDRTSEYQKIDLTLKKQEIIADIKDLELDQQLGKIAEQDYQELYDQAFAEGTRVLESLDKLKKSEPVVDKKDNAPQFCHQCGAGLVDHAKFCSQCGVKL